MTLVRDVRSEVFALDGGCVAPIIDPEAGPCFDQWGEAIYRTDLHNMEMDYVRYGAEGKRHELVQDHITACPGHHRGAGPNRGFQWTTANRVACREYLRARAAKGKR